MEDDTGRVSVRRVDDLCKSKKTENRVFGQTLPAVTLRYKGHTRWQISVDLEGTSRLPVQKGVSGSLEVHWNPKQT